MRISLTQHHVNYIYYNDENALFIRSCFYLGLSLMHIREVLSNASLMEDEISRTIETASVLGMNDSDIITLI